MPDPQDAMSGTKSTTVYEDDNFAALTGSLQAGVFPSSTDPNAGTQVGVRDSATSIVGQASLGDLLGSDTTSTQGGWENFLSAEAHGPAISGEGSIGTAGAAAQLGADAMGVSVTVGGAEYDLFGGSELTVGASVGVGGGTNLTWTDDDGDNCRELGGSLTIEALEGLSVSGKTEVLGKLDNYLGPKVLAGGDALLATLRDLAASDEQPLPAAPAPAPADPRHPTEVGFTR